MSTTPELISETTANRIQQFVVIVVWQFKAELPLNEVLSVPNFALIATFASFIDHASVVRIAVVAG